MCFLSVNEMTLYPC